MKRTKHPEEQAYIDAFNRLMETPPVSPESAQRYAEMLEARAKWSAVKQPG